MVTAPKERGASESAPASAGLLLMGGGTQAVRKQSDGTWNIHADVAWPGIYGRADSGVGRAIQCIVGSGSIVDLGAGAGSYGAFLDECTPGARPRWRGYEGNADVESFTRRGPPGAFTRHLNFCNTSSATELPAPADWVMSIEVAEHLPPSCIPTFLGLINSTARHGVVLSWSSDHRGRGHISPKYFAGVVRAMARLGFTLDMYATMWARVHAFVPWLRNGLGVYVRNGTAAAAQGTRYDLINGRSEMRCPRPGDGVEMRLGWRIRFSHRYAGKNCSIAEKLLPCACYCEAPHCPPHVPAKAMRATLRAGAWSVDARDENKKV